MSRHSRVAHLVIFLLALISAASAGDLKVVSVARFQDGKTYATTRYSQGERMRVEWRDQTTWRPGLVTYGPPRATIYQCDALQAIDLNLKTHEYTTLELNDDCQTNSRPIASTPTGTLNVYIESVDTGERREILGRTARHIITHQRQVGDSQSCWHLGEMEQDGWYIDMPPSTVEQKLRRHAADEYANVTMTGANCRDKIEIHRTGVEKPGFPVKFVQTVRFSHQEPDGKWELNDSTSRWESEITEISEAPLDAALFNLPAGFTKVAKLDARPEMPFTVAVGYWWDRTMSKVRSWF